MILKNVSEDKKREKAIQMWENKQDKRRRKAEQERGGVQVQIPQKAKDCKLMTSVQSTVRLFKNKLT